MKVFGPASLVALGGAAVSCSAFVVSAPPRPNRGGQSVAGASTTIRRPAALSARKKPAPSEDDGENDASSSDKMDPAKRAALDGVLAQIERNYGRGSVVRLGDDPDSLALDVIPSGALPLDAILGGGYPKGRVVEIYGPESSGKTTLALHAVAEAQRDGGVAAFVDAEHALDPGYAADLGVDTDALLVSQPDSGEMALDVVDRLVRSSAVDVVVVDSVAALVPRAELEGDMSDQQIGLQARLMSKAMRKIVGSLAMSQCTVIFLNQLRSKVGVIYGSPEVTSGGNALKFYSSVRLDTRRRDILPDNSGIRVRVKAVKNKVAPPFRECHVDILFGSGIDTAGCLLDAAVDLGVVERRGSWYSYGETNFSQGRHNAAEKLREDGELAERIEADVRGAMRRSSRGDADEAGPGSSGGSGTSSARRPAAGRTSFAGEKEGAAAEAGIIEGGSGLESFME
mmetsp:Transcript_28162/g.82992  ORF Transcript_28162/g.82992 Transcript_28162/m.82992 type:complete len:455 (-) Transcript_28162:54-1418(-)